MNGEQQKRPQADWQLLIAQQVTPCETITMQGVDVVVKRDDVNHPIIQGNKLRKLKYNLQAALEHPAELVITFGGAYSNHLIATAFASQCIGMPSIGIVRGDELANQQDKWSETLKQCHQCGMQLFFVSREDYRQKSESAIVQEILTQNPHHWLIPEGGSNRYALDGVAEIINELELQLPVPPTHLFCPVGTGGTLAGLVKGVRDKKWHCKIYGTAVLKGLQYVNNDINQWLINENNLPNFEILQDYHGGGYAKNTEKLNNFGVQFAADYGFQLDKIYNNKSFYALSQMIQSGQITSQHRPVIIHTGGLQGGVNNQQINDFNAKRQQSTL